MMWCITIEEVEQVAELKAKPTAVSDIIGHQKSHRTAAVPSEQMSTFGYQVNHV